MCLVRRAVFFLWRFVGEVVEGERRAKGAENLRVGGCRTLFYRPLYIPPYVKDYCTSTDRRQQGKIEPLKTQILGIEP
jgi:hypothetical protein